MRPISRALALSVGPAVGIGLARFGYAVLLPAMQVDLAWSYTEAGGMNTANSVGYLAGALVAAPLSRGLGVTAAYRGSILATAVSMALCGLTVDFQTLLALRVVAGIGGAVALITGATIAAGRVSEAGPALGRSVIGVYFGGVGLGIMVTGLGLPVLLEAAPQLWAAAWLSLGALSLLAYPMARQASADGRASAPQGEKHPRTPFMRADLLPSFVAYLLFGLGYITYMTFVIAFLGERAWGAWGRSGFWVLLGASTFASGFVWPRLFRRLRPGHALTVRLSALTVGATAPLVSSGPLGVVVSAVLFGGSFLSVVSVITEILRRALHRSAWAAGIALFTVSFSVGQAFGPVVAGAVSDRAGSLSGGFVLSAVVLAASAVVAAFQRPVSDAPVMESVGV